MKKVFSILMAVLILVTSTWAAADGRWYCPNCGRLNDDNFCPKDGTPRPSDMAGQSTTIAVGDTIVFGRYEQDNHSGNGQEPIEWIVLDIVDGRALVISKLALEARNYHDSRKPVTWEKCTLRKWLNEEFVRHAFSTTEQAAILVTQVGNGPDQCCSKWKTNGGSDTMDRVFLLSYAEALKYFSTDEARGCWGTDYMLALGAWQSSGTGNVCWRLRSPGNQQIYSAVVDGDGSILNGHNVANDSDGIRPAMWIDLSCL